ncbi:MAG: hypothetical protein ABIO44_09035, partial [Saprospiraceae bacterium]
MKNNYYFLYYFFDNPYVRWMRVLLFLSMGVLVYLNLGNGRFVISILPIYCVLILQEFFIHFKLENSNPPKKITDKFKHVIECVDYKSRAHLERYNNLEKIIGEFSNVSESQYLSRLLNFKFLYQVTDITEEDILRKARDVVASAGGKYIHAIDIYVSYLILTDEKSRELFKNDITQKDILHVHSWVRKLYSIDLKHHTGLRFSGSGVFDFFVFGWSEQIARFASNFTKEVLSNSTTSPMGRNSEYDLLITALLKNSSSNALLVGGAGVGKTTLISKFVIDSNEGLLPSHISNKTVFKLYAERLIAGINNTGDLETRFIELFSELSHAGNIIVYIPNIENIFGGGGLNFDISGALIEYLRSNQIKIIGSTTDEAFHSYIYQKQEIKALFDIIEMNEPDEDTALFMVLEKASELEHLNNVTISYDAVKESCALSDSYATDGSAM